MIAEQTGNEKAAILAEALNEAITRYLENERTPSRKVNEIDNRGSTYYLAMYWAQALTAQRRDTELQARFSEIAKTLEGNEAVIVEELLAAQGEPVDLGGYYLTDPEKAAAAMCPSATLNAIIAG